MPITTRYDQISAHVSRFIKQYISDIYVTRRDVISLGNNTVGRQVMCNVSARKITEPVPAQFRINGQNLNLFCFFQHRHRVTDRACGVRTAVPRDQHIATKAVRRRPCRNQQYR